MQRVCVDALHRSLACRITLRCTMGRRYEREMLSGMRLTRKSMLNRLALARGLTETCLWSEKTCGLAEGGDTRRRLT